MTKDHGKYSSIKHIDLLPLFLGEDFIFLADFQKCISQRGNDFILGWALHKIHNAIAQNKKSTQVLKQRKSHLPF